MDEKIQIKQTIGLSKLTTLKKTKLMGWKKSNQINHWVKYVNHL